MSVIYIYFSSFVIFNNLNLFRWSIWTNVYLSIFTSFASTSSLMLSLYSGLFLPHSEPWHHACLVSSPDFFHSDPFYILLSNSTYRNIAFIMSVLQEPTGAPGYLYIGLTALFREKLIPFLDISLWILLSSLGYWYMKPICK